MYKSSIKLYITNTISMVNMMNVFCKTFIVTCKQWKPQSNISLAIFVLSDPTAGPSANEQTSWCLDEATLHENVKKTLVKFCVPSPMVFRWILELSFLLQIWPYNFPHLFMNSNNRLSIYTCFTKCNMF